MPIAKINNIDCYYEVHGEGKPLMLIGGLASDSQTWSLILNRLKHCFKVIVFDNRGVGRTKDKGAPFDIPAMVKDAIMLLDHLGVENSDILGHSMGGYIAQEIAITNPARVSRLILASTASSTSDRNKKLFQELANVYADDASYEAFLREFLPWIFTPKYLKDNMDDLIQFLLAYQYRQSPEDFRRQADACIKFDSVGRIGEIRSNTMILSGEKDILIPEEETDFLSSSIENAEVKYLPNTAHSLPVESPKEFAGEICA